MASAIQPAQLHTPAQVAAPQTGIQISEFVPQGRVSAVEAVQVRFSAAAIRFGDPDTAAPIRLVCEGQVPEGQGRWLDESRWAYVFERALPAGVACAARSDADFRTLDGQPLPGGLAFEFDTGAPSIVDARPHQGTAIDEEQAFILNFSAAVDAAEVAARSHCVVQGLAERIPVRSLGAEDLESLLEAAYMPQPDNAASVALLQCARALPPEADVRLEVGPGIRALDQPPGLAGSEAAHILQYEVRPPFTAKLSCTRERAGQPCLPITPLTVMFSSPVPRSSVQGIRLSADGVTGASKMEFKPELPVDELEAVSYLTFPGPFPAKSTLTLTLPGDLKDDAERSLQNAARFPLSVQIADFPPLARFASGTFGVIERFAHAPPGTMGEEAAAVPVTLRHIEPDPMIRGAAWSSGQVASLRSVNDAEVMGWFGRLQRLESGRWSPAQVKDIIAGRAPRADSMNWSSRLDARSVSLLKHQPAARQLSLPAADSGELRPFEVVGIPLSEPGFHVLEIESPRLGASLLEDGASMYVRTGVLLTNLAVHVKQGRDDLLVWVTSLADASPVEQAEISVRDCNGRQLASGRSNAQGVWHHLARIEAENYCRDTGLNGLFISARIPADHPQAHGAADYAFVMSGWDKGIENWRFNVPTSSGPEPDQVAHTVFDRSLFRVGESVSMQHYLRVETRDGLRLPEGSLPDHLTIEHEGSGQQYEFPVEWKRTASGGLTAVNTFNIPESANLGTYSVRLTDRDRRWYGSQQFRVEEFRLPLLAGQLAISGGERPGILVAPEHLAVDMQLAWLSGGAAMGQEVELNAVSQERGVYIPAYEEYSFLPPPSAAEGAVDAENSDTSYEGQRKLFVDGLRFRLDDHGMARVEVDGVPAVARPQRFVFEAGFADPNGEIQTLSQTVEVWPSAVQAGIMADSWERAGEKIPVNLIALGTDAQPQAGVPLKLVAVERKNYSVRKRMVGGFYRYDSHSEWLPPRTLCQGVSDSQGKLECTVSFEQAGSFELVVEAQDLESRVSQAYRRIWISDSGQLWFGGREDDRIDLIPAKREWEGGEEAEFQVRMPFSEALAMVTVEREGVLWSRLMKLEGSNPLVRIPVSAAWGPNAYVSVLVLRGRLYELPWQSFLDWGWKDPASWFRARLENRDETLITTQVDLAKPAFRIGLAELRVAGQAHRLQVALTPSSEVLHVREAGSVKVRVSLPNGQPAAHGTVSFAMVDEALLELAPNDTWNLYEAMHPRRRLAVRTATSQLEVVGRRHYGRKAVAAGGGGGSLPTRQLFDTLLSWQPIVELDENGEAKLDFRMNDALSRFRLVVLADHGAGYFGSASTTVVSRQDLQLVAGLPPVVREGDSYAAQVTLRNGTEETREIKVQASYEIQGRQQSLPVRALSLASGALGVVNWQLEVPELGWPSEGATIRWQLDAGDMQIADSVVTEQQLLPRLPVTTVQASLLGLEAGESLSLPVSPPEAAMRSDAGPAYGGIALDVASSLVGSLEGVQDWWTTYPYTCLEQSASQALALNDGLRWGKVADRLLTHMDSDGLLRYFPGTGPGSEVLTAYLVSVVDDARRLGMSHALPPQALARMLNGLQAFVEGRISRNQRWSDSSLDSRRLMAMEALSRHGRAKFSMLASLKQSPELWPTPSVVDWLAILSRLPQGQQRDHQIVQARSVLMSRMTVSGAAMVFSDTPFNAAPGLMATRSTSLARLILTVVDLPQWHDDVPRMVQGLLSMQQRGRWAITTENLLGVQALAAYARRFESQPASGSLQARLAGEQSSLLLPGKGETTSERLGWPVESGELELSYQGEGRVWVGIRAQARTMADVPRGTGYRVSRQVVPVQQQLPGQWSQGDIYRVEIQIDARDAASWVVLDDPVPAGATILRSGLGRDAGASLPSFTGDTRYHPSFVERSFSAYRAYFEHLPAGQIGLAYNVRLNVTGSFSLPPTQVRALYLPDLYGSFPNHEGVTVGQGRSTDGTQQ